MRQEFVVESVRCHVNALDALAGLTGIQDTGAKKRCCRPVDVRTFQHDGRVLAAKFQEARDKVAGGLPPPTLRPVATLPVKQTASTLSPTAAPVDPSPSTIFSTAATSGTDRQSLS